MMLVIISGRSGSGKSVALRALEDAGFYCVDNLPVALLPDLAKTLIKTNRSAAVSIDIRNLPENNDEFKAALDNIPENFKPKLVFLDTDRDTLIRRYSNTRRLHPLSTQDLTLEEAIDKEYVLLEYLHQHADHVIDTTKLSVHELSELLRLQLLHTDQKELHIVIESFGFKHGIPKDADYVFDVRFLPNPHWVPELQSLTGLDAPVKHFLQQHTEVHKFIYQTRNYLELWLPYLEKNNRSYLTIAIGCTGGQHRSVYVAEELGNYFRLKNKNVQTRHRTLLAEKQNIE